MLIFCRCCKHLCFEDDRIKCNVLDINKSRETADAWQACSRFEYHYRPEAPALFDILKTEREARK